MLNSRSSRISVWVGLILVIAACRGPKELVYDRPTQDVELKDFFAAMKSTLEEGETFEWKGKANYKSATSDVDFNYTLRLSRDSVIWVDITDPFIGLKVARALIYPDSAVFYNRLESTWMAGGLDLVQNKLQLGLDFQHVQTLLLGEPLYMPQNEKDIELKRDTGVLAATVKGQEGDPLFAFGNPAYEYNYGYLPGLPLTSQHLPDGPRDVRINYRYRQDDSGIPVSIELLMSWDAEVILRLNHSEVRRDIDLHVPFSIPNGYERIR